jgi:hypothetical protein
MGKMTKIITHCDNFVIHESLNYTIFAGDLKRKILKSILKNITVGFLIVVMMVSTMGFSINTMYCLCMGQYEVSLFEIDHKCDKEEEKPDPAIAKMHPCCQKAMMEKACKEKKEHKGCTQHEKKYVKADLKFTEFHKTEMPKVPTFEALPVCFHTIPVYLKVAFISEIQPILAYRPPPQYHGRKLLNFIQVYRC